MPPGRNRRAALLPRRPRPRRARRRAPPPRAAIPRAARPPAAATRRFPASARAWPALSATTA
ncbi:MAG: hypothetical protein E6H77_03045 [Betaproteobacteria bacterium]|nr:MAG: hypothetical protein E6H77_03045 [Betaproteobacteria bacterium]